MHGWVVGALNLHYTLNFFIHSWKKRSILGLEKSSWQCNCQLRPRMNEILHWQHKKHENNSTVIYNDLRWKFKVMNVIGFKPACIIWFNATLTPSRVHSFFVFVMRSGNSTDSEAKSSLKERNILETHIPWLLMHKLLLEINLLQRSIIGVAGGLYLGQELHHLLVYVSHLRFQEQ